MGSAMAGRLARTGLSEGVELLIPVPISAGRMKSRGYNQAALLARQISEDTGIPAREGLLQRCRETAPMKGLSVPERHENLKRAFTVSRNDVKCKIIMLVDDIYTTGATLDACAEVLLEAGARRVYFVVFAIGESSLC